MSAPAYMPFYVADFLADTTHLSQGEVGAYVLLLMAMWRAGGRLSLEDAKLARIARCGPKAWTSTRETVLAFFEVEDGHITQMDRYRRHIYQPSPKREYVPGWAARRIEVFERDGWSCVYCGNLEGPFEVDHFYPRSLGGSDELGNLRCSCGPCNRSKGATVISDTAL